MNAPPGTTPTLTAYREASNREKSRNAAHRLQGAERVYGIRLSPSARRIAVKKMLEHDAHKMTDEAFIDWLPLVIELPLGRSRKRNTSACDNRMGHGSWRAVSS